jgi:hypothetical protein
MSKAKSKLGVVAYAYNFNIGETEAEGSWVSGQPGLHGEFKASLSYILRSCLQSPKRII